MSDQVPSTWTPTDPGVLTLPGGRLVRGRSRRRPAHSDPDWALVLAGRRPEPPAWPIRWVVWPDFRLPRDDEDALAALREVYDRCGHERVEVTCGGGVGRTGTALAALVMLDGLAPADAIAWVRRGYHPRAVETTGQRRWLARISLSGR